MVTSVHAPQLAQSPPAQHEHTWPVHIATFLTTHGTGTHFQRVPADMMTQMTVVSGTRGM